MGFMIKKRGHL